MAALHLRFTWGIATRWISIFFGNRALSTYRLAAAARKVDLERLPDISTAGRSARDYGIEL